jgi:hypothetical protein
MPAASVPARAAVFFLRKILRFIVLWLRAKRPLLYHRNASAAFENE